jgi:hypothetical protein
MTPEQQRLTDLERENAKLKAKLQRLGLMPKTVDLPNDAEVDQLIALIEAAHPALKPVPQQHFANALHFLTFAYRADEFSKYATTVHLDECSVWLQKFDIAGGTSMKAFIAAAIASRFKHSKTDDFPFVELAIGLGASARPVSAWRVTLKENKVPPPTEPKRRAPAQAQVVQLNIAPALRRGQF